MTGSIELRRMNPPRCRMAETANHFRIVRATDIVSYPFVHSYLQLHEIQYVQILIWFMSNLISDYIRPIAWPTGRFMARQVHIE
jgi:hypothetical protein